MKCRASEYLPQWVADEKAVRAPAAPPTKKNNVPEIPAPPPEDTEASGRESADIPITQESEKPEPAATDKRPVRKYREK